MNTNATAVTSVCNDISATAANLVAQIVKSQEGKDLTSPIDIFTQIYSSEFSNEINNTLIINLDFEKYDNMEVFSRPEISITEMDILRRRLATNGMMEIDTNDFSVEDAELIENFRNNLNNARRTVNDLISAIDVCKDMIYLAQTAAYASADLFKLEMYTGANLLLKCNLLGALKIRQIMLDLRLIEIDAMKYLLEARIAVS